MRYDAEHKQRTRERVLAEAARALREEGPERVAVAGLMARAGLTHGGFYAHFPSKDALVAEAIATAFQDGRGALEQAATHSDPRQALRGYIGVYLSRSHRDEPGRGCPLPALASDLPRLSPEARARYAAGVAALTKRLSGLIAAAGLPDPDTLAGSVMAEMVGALSLARAVPDPAQSDALIRTSRAAIYQRLGLSDLPAAGPKEPA